MGQNKKYRLGELIEQCTDVNINGKYTASDVMGMTITKEIIPTKANVDGTDLKNFLIIKPKEFIYNPRTHGKRIGFGFNDTDTSFIISCNNIGFKIKQVAKEIVVPEYLFMHFNRLEWDREACYRSWGTSTEVFSWDALCGMQITLPPLSTQQKAVAVYNELKENLAVYESGLEDLKLTCDGFIEELRRNNTSEQIGKYITRQDIRNGSNGTKNIIGISVLKQFRKPTSKVNTNDLAKYKVVKPRQIAFVQTTNNEKVFAYAFNDTSEDIVVSSVNEVFSINEKKLCPEYLMMFFSRPEFDRYSRFHSCGSARETFDWSEMCNVKIPLPDIKIQQSIADIYSCYIERKRIAEELREELKNICPLLLRGALEAGENNL